MRQAASASVLFATVPDPGGPVASRFIDALIGAGVALAINLVIAPMNPLRHARRAAEPALDALADMLDDIAVALRSGEHEQAIEVLTRANSVDEASRELRGQVAAGLETARLAPLRRRHRPTLEQFTEAARRIDVAQRDVRLLARSVLRAVDLDEHVPEHAIRAIGDLAICVRALRDQLLFTDQRDNEAAMQAALRAAGRTALALEMTTNLSVSMIVGTIRTTAVDLLRSMGLDGDAARVAVRKAAFDIEGEEGAG
jgi:hypothetical protein